MSKFEHSFEKVYEALITRYTAGCFSAGDVVKFDTKAIQKSDAYKGLTKSLKSRLDDMMRTSDAGETVIVVTDVALGHDNPKAHTPVTMSIAYSQGGGRWVEPITIPGALAEFMDAVEPGVNLVDKIPSVSKITYPVETQAHEVDLKELEKNRTKGHASLTLHGESYSNYSPSASSDLEMEVSVYLDIEDAIKRWIKNYKYEKPQMGAKQLYIQTLKQVSSIDGFGYDEGDEGKNCFFVYSVTANTSDAKWYAGTNYIGEDLAKKILSPFNGIISDSFEKYLLDNLDDFVEIYGDDNWEDIVNEDDDDWDD